MGESPDRNNFVTLLSDYVTYSPTYLRKYSGLTERKNKRNLCISKNMREAKVCLKLVKK